jgi:hypothetical protein
VKYNAISSPTPTSTNSLTPTKTPTPTPTSNPQYKDYNVPTTIDKTGATDVTTALNNWVQTIPNGTATQHSRVVFPQGATYMVSRGIVISGKSHITFWGNGTTIKVNPNAVGLFMYTSAFNLGWVYKGDPTAALSSGVLCTDIRITGFSGVASHISPAGYFYETYETQSFIEATRVDGLEVDHNTNVRGFGGDFIRINSSNIHIHDNSQLNSGRQFVTVNSGSKVLVENNSMGSVGYWFLDIEPNAGTQSVTDVDFINNSGISHSYGISGGLASIGNPGPGGYDTIGRIHVRNNILTGSTRSYIYTLIGQMSGNRMTDIAITGNSGSSSISVASCKTVVDKHIGGLIEAKVVDGLTVTGNYQSNLSGPFVCVLTSTNVNTTNPPNTTN